MKFLSGPVKNMGTGKRFMGRGQGAGSHTEMGMGHFVPVIGQGVITLVTDSYVFVHRKVCNQVNLE